MEARRARGIEVSPVRVKGRTIARSFWGQAWCSHVELFSDYANRLPRGRTYVRNGSVCHLGIEKGAVEAFVAGSHVYQVKVGMKTLALARWKDIRKMCSGRIGSLVEILSGRISDHVMGVVTNRDTGLFPDVREMSFSCSCPDWADMCKHVAAVLYGVAARLDEQPELLFLLRGVDPADLLPSDRAVALDTGKGRSTRLAPGSIEDVFGIELDRGKDDKGGEVSKKKPRARRRAPGRPRKKARRKSLPGRPKKAPLKRKPSLKGADRKQTPWTGKAVTALRRRLGMTMEDFSLLAGLTHSTVQKWERRTPADGILRLKTDSRFALDTLKAMSKREASRILKDLR
jgi:uncharacterized Zn finger protein